MTTKTFYPLTLILFLFSGALFAQNVGVNTDKPQAPLHVFGPDPANDSRLVILGDTNNVYLKLDHDQIQSRRTITQDELKLQPEGGDLRVGNNLIFADASTGFVGVGTGNPDTELQLSGEMRLTTAGFSVDQKDKLAIRGLLENQAMLGLGFLRDPNGGVGTILGGSSNGSRFQSIYEMYYRSQGAHRWFINEVPDPANLSPSMILTPQEYLGIGLEEPLRNIHSVGIGDVKIRMQTYTQGSTETGIEMIRPGVDWRIVNDGGILKFFDGNNDFSTDGDENLRIMSSGNIGITVANPLTKLHIDNGTDTNLGSGGYLTLGSIVGLNVSYDNNEIQARNDGLASTLSLQNDGGELHLVNGGGDLGIGTNNPLSGVYVLNRDVRIDDDGNVRSILLDHNGSGGAGEIDLYNVNGDLSIEIEASETGGQGAEINMRNNGGTPTIILDADFNGDGRIITDELEIKGGSDLSEHFAISSAETEVQAGMLVSIDPSVPGALMLTTEAYDKKVAGIVSGANGIETGLIMGQEGTIADGDYPVALTGRVYVNAEADSHAIQPGDLLTSSDVAGHAMKVTNLEQSQGAIIGKAMTALEAGRGYVLVLVSLQ